MIIVGVDLATSCGVCFGSPGSVPTATAWRAPSSGEDLGAFGAFFWLKFNDLFARLFAETLAADRILVNYEAPVLIEKRWDDEKKRMTGGNPIVTTRKLQGLGVLLETLCKIHPQADRIQIGECHLSTIKKELTGNGRADKGQMVLAAQRAGIDLPPGKEAFDAADAFGAWLLAVRFHAPQFQRQWDQRLHGPIRGIR